MLISAAPKSHRERVALFDENRRRMGGRNRRLARRDYDQAGM